MAIVKDLRDTYWCKTDEDRNRITPYAGQKCLMTNGDLYVCLHYGEWSKIGDAPTPPTPPTPSVFPLTIQTTDMVQESEGEILYCNSASGRLGIEAGEQLSLTFNYSGGQWSTTGTAVSGSLNIKLVEFDIETMPTVLSTIISVIGLVDGYILYPTYANTGYTVQITTTGTQTPSDLQAVVTSIVINKIV